MPITTLPALSRTAITFKADVDTFFGTQLPAFATEANALESNVNAKEASAVSSAATATTKAGEASASAAAALASQNSAGTSAATATTKAGEAVTSANAASASANTATTKAAEAAASAAAVVRDGSGGVAGLTLFKLNLRNAANTFTSFLTNAATAARTWTMPDKDGTVAMTSDFAAPGPIGSTTPSTVAATTLSATGKLTVGAKAILEAPAWDTGYLALRHSALAETAATSALFQSAGGSTFLNSVAGQSLYLGINGVVVGAVTATGLAVTGALSATGKISTTAPATVSAAAKVSDWTNPIYLGSLANNGESNFFSFGAVGGVSTGIAGIREASGWNTALAFYTNNVTGSGAVDQIKEAGRFDSGRNFFVGATAIAANKNYFVFSPGNAFSEVGHETGVATGTAFENFRYAGVVIGSIAQNGTTAVVYNTTSDRRLKTNIRPADAARFMEIEFMDYEWVDGRHDCGPIADQLQALYPSLVIGEKDATEVRQVEIVPAVPAVLEKRLVSPAIPAVIGVEATDAVEASPAEYTTVVTEEVVLLDGVETTITRSSIVQTKAAVEAKAAVAAVEARDAVDAIYEDVIVTPAIPAVIEAQTFPVYQQVNYTGLIGRIGTRVQQLQRTVDAQAALIAAMESRLAALEAA